MKLFKKTAYSNTPTDCKRKNLIVCLMKNTLNIKVKVIKIP